MNEEYLYELSYNLYMAESELNSSLLMEGGNIITNNAVDVLQEGVKETVMKYIDKVAQSVQGAWDKFKNLIDEKQKERWESLKKYINQAPNDLSYTIDDFMTYDLQKFNDLKLPIFNYEEMKEFSDTNENFMGHYYPSIPINRFDNIGQAIGDALGAKVANKQNVDTEFLKNQYKFLTEDYYTMRDDMQKDIDTVNNSNKVISSIVNAMQSTEESAMYFLETTMALLEDDGKAPVVTDNNDEQELRTPVEVELYQVSK